MKKTDGSEKGLEDIIVDHLVAVNGYELGKSDDFDLARVWYAEQNSAELNGGRKPLL